MSRIARGSLLALSVLIVLVVYWPGLNGPLILDDVPNLLPLKLLAQQNTLSFERVMAERLPGIDGRPVAMLSFLLNWRMTGDSIWWLKLTNLTVHLLSGVLAYLLVRQLLAVSGVADALAARWFSLWVVAAWLLLPIHVSTVLYVVQRMASLSALFCLAGLVSWMGARRVRSEHPLFAALLFASTFVIWLPLAAGSKQTGALLPYLIVVIEIWFVARGALPPMPKPARALLGVACVLPALALVLRFARDPKWLTDAYALRDFTLGERLLSAPRVLIDYAANVLQIPGASALGLFRDDVYASSGILTPPTTVMSAIVLVAIVSLAVRYTDRRASVVLGGAMFFLVAHALESSFPAIELYFEHRNYLPSLGLMIAVAAAAALACRRQRIRLAISLALPALVMLYAVTTAIRVDVWRSWPTIVAANLSAHPSSPRAQAARAILAIEARDLGEANDALDSVLRLAGPKRRFGVTLKRLIAHCRADVTAPNMLLEELDDATPIQDDPYTVAALSWLRENVSGGQCDGQLNLAELAERIDRAVLVSEPELLFDHSWTLHRDAAELLLASGERVRARAQLDKAIALAPPSRRAALADRLAELRE